MQQKDFNLRNKKKKDEMKPSKKEKQKFNILRFKSENDFFTHCVKDMLTEIFLKIVIKKESFLSI